MKKIAIASDHAGYNLKSAILEQFRDRYDWLDLGTNSTDSVDYPDFGKKLAETIINGEAEQGVLICGSGIGISIAANRYKEIRAANCTDVTMARLSRQHNDANVVALGERLVGQQVAFDIIETFLSTEFEGGRHQNRVNKLGNENS
ncbi:MAG: ribose 5-phosphate isomerase B [Alphaproteobacteria bacterium]|nr:ribose 5-phosphate isomerase B [Alphaproteobacteria bacterium]